MSDGYKSMAGPQVSSDSGLPHIKRNSHLIKANKPAWCQFWTPWTTEVEFKVGLEDSADEDNQIIR